MRVSLALIKSLGSTKKLAAEHFRAIDSIFDEQICISPYTIFRLPLHKEVCKTFNEISQFGSDLRLALDAEGAFAFLDQVHDRGHSQGVIERIISVFAISSAGLSQVGDATLDFIHAVVDFFRSKNGLGWNRDVIGTSEIASQCLSNIIIGLAKVFADPTLMHKARKHRSGSIGKNPSWVCFSAVE